MPIRPATLAFLAMVLLSGGAPVLAAADPGAVAAPSSSALSADDQAAVQKAVAYIDNLKAVEGRFTQSDGKGRASTGAFYLQRPGKVRFQYDPPAALLVVSDGSDVSVYDRKLKSFDQYPLTQTPLALLLAKPFRLDHGVTVLAVDQSKDELSITAGDARRRSAGRLTLKFSKTPLALKGWTLVDAQGQKTTVAFSALRAKSSLDPALFVLRNPKPHAGDSNVMH